MMNTIFSKSIPVVFTISLILFFSSMGNSNIYGQGTENATQSPPPQQPSQQNQTSQSNQPGQPQQQQNQSKSQDSKMHEKLLNITNTAVIAFNEGNDEVLQASLTEIQNTLINATGKEVVVVPVQAAPSVVAEDNEEDSE